MYPLDLVRALKMANAGAELSTIQLLSNFRKAHGIQGFFTQGLAPELARSTWMRFIKFSLFPLTHLTLFGRDEKQGSSVTRALSAIIASFPEAMSIMPLEVAKIALQLDNSNKYKNDLAKAVFMLSQERGVGVFALGYFGIQMRQMLWSVGYFTSISFFQKQIEHAAKLIAGNDFNLKANPTANVIATTLAGFGGGVFGGVLNTPFDTVRSALQKNFLLGGPNAVAQTFSAVARDVVKKRGPQGLYAGFGFKAMHLGGGGALMAFLIPFFNDVFDKIN
jgi:solute carrier family 25 2-oxodicarboxylate transporter 21